MPTAVTGWKPSTKIRIGVISDPPPIPVAPTTVPDEKTRQQELPGHDPTPQTAIGAHEALPLRLGRTDIAPKGGQIQPLRPSRPAGSGLSWIPCGWGRIRRVRLCPRLAIGRPRRGLCLPARRHLRRAGLRAVRGARRHRPRPGRLGEQLDDALRRHAGRGLGHVGLHDRLFLRASDVAIDILDPAHPVIGGQSAFANAPAGHHDRQRSRAATRTSSARTATANSERTTTTTAPATASRSSTSTTNPAHPTIVGSIHRRERAVRRLRRRGLRALRVRRRPGLPERAAVPERERRRLLRRRRRRQSGQPDDRRLDAEQRLPAPWTGTERAQARDVRRDLGQLRLRHGLLLEPADRDRHLEPVEPDDRRVAARRHPAELPRRRRCPERASPTSSTRSSNGRVAVVDVSNPANPHVVGSVVNSTWLNGAYRIRLRGNFAYVSGGEREHRRGRRHLRPDQLRASPAATTSAAALNRTTGLDLDSSGRYVIATSPYLSTRAEPDVYPPYPFQPGGPTITGTISSIDLDPAPDLGRRSRGSSRAGEPDDADLGDVRLLGQRRGLDRPLRARRRAVRSVHERRRRQSYSSLGVGSHTFTVQAIDPAGNTVDATATLDGQLRQGGRSDDAGPRQLQPGERRGRVELVADQARHRLRRDEHLRQRGRRHLDHRHSPGTTGTRPASAPTARPTSRSTLRRRTRSASARASRGGTTATPATSSRSARPAPGRSSASTTAARPSPSPPARPSRSPPATRSRSGSSARSSPLSTTRPQRGWAQVLELRHRPATRSATPPPAASHSSSRPAPSTTSAAARLSRIRRRRSTRRCRRSRGTTTVGQQLTRPPARWTATPAPDLHLPVAALRQPAPTAPDRRRHRNDLHARRRRRRQHARGRRHRPPTAPAPPPPLRLVDRRQRRPAPPVNTAPADDQRHDDRRPAADRRRTGTWTGQPGPDLHLPVARAATRPAPTAPRSAARPQRPTRWSAPTSATPRASPSPAPTAPATPPPTPPRRPSSSAAAPPVNTDAAGDQRHDDRRPAAERRPGSWTGQPGPDLHLPVARCDTAGANCTADPAPPQATYTPSPTTSAARVRVTVTAHQRAGSNATAPAYGDRRSGPPARAGQLAAPADHRHDRPSGQQLSDDRRHLDRRRRHRPSPTSGSAATPPAPTAPRSAAPTHRPTPSSAPTSATRIAVAVTGHQRARQRHRHRRLSRRHPAPPAAAGQHRRCRRSRARRPSASS